MPKRLFRRICREFLLHPSWWFFGWAWKDKAYVDRMIDEEIRAFYEEGE